MVLSLECCVLTRESLRYPEEIFAFFLDNGTRSVGFNLEEVENANTTSSFTRSDRPTRSVLAQEYPRRAQEYPRRETGAQTPKGLFSGVAGLPNNSELGEAPAYSGSRRKRSCG
jgi:hypothetical protein